MDIVAYTDAVKGSPLGSFGHRKVAYKCEGPNHYSADHQANQPTNKRTGGHIGQLNFQ